MNARIDDLAERRIAFSNRLRQLLQQCGHNPIPAQLAREFEFSAGAHLATAQTFSNWLNGVQLPRPNTLQALATWLRTTPDFLENGVAILHFAPTKADSDDEHQMLADFRQLDAYGRRVARTMMASLARLKAGAA